MISSTNRWIVAMIVVLFAVTGLFAQQQDKDSQEKILADQQRLAEQYDLLEQKLFSLYQFEQDQNPDRSELLQKAFQASQEKLTLQKFKSAVRQLGQSRFRNAENSQVEIVAELKELLELLQSEDRGKRVRDQIDQYKEYVKEINRILRIQQGIRGQSERGDQGERLKEDQERNAGRTGDLENKFGENESANDSPVENESENSDPGGQQSRPGEPESEGQQGNPAESEPGQGQQNDQETPQETNPVQQNLQKAEQKMREARQKMDEAKRDESLAEMRQAEQELEQARHELERILRQLREEEIKRTLASMESRFRRMLELQIKIHDDTVALDLARENSSVDEVEIQSGKLAMREKGLVTETARALLVLEDEGSSIAVTESLLQIQQDMQQVADRLSTARTSTTTQEIQQSIIETLGFLVEVFEEAQSEQGQAQSNQSQQGKQQPGDEALINQLAELKLVRGLQSQILTRHSRYSQLLENPTDEVGHSSDPGIVQALEQLGERQQKLHQITHDIVVGKNR